MFGADSADVVAVCFGCEAVAGVGAEQAEGMLVGKIVPKLLEADGGVALTFVPEESDHLAEGDGEFCVRTEAGFGVHEVRLDGGEEGLRIGPAVDHETSEGGFGVKQKILTVLDGAHEIDAGGAEALGEALAAGFGGDDEGGAAGFEGRAYEDGEFVEKGGVVVVELDRVGTGVGVVSKMRVESGRSGVFGLVR